MENHMDSNCKGLFSEVEAATYLSVSRKTLQGWRWLGTGPRFVKISARCVRYRLADLALFVEERLRDNTAQCGR